MRDAKTAAQRRTALERLATSYRPAGCSPSSVDRIEIVLDRTVKTKKRAVRRVRS